MDVGGTTTGRGGLVLVMDDEFVVRDLIEAVLTKVGYRV